MNNKDKYIIRNCKHHGDVKFILENRGYYRCTQCRNNAVSRKRQTLKKDLVDYKGGKCEKCGYDKCVSALDFHHKDTNEKDFGLSSNGCTRGWKKLTQEADKCLLLCSNCHREVHQELNGYKESRADIKQKTYKSVNLCTVCNSNTYNKKYCSNTCAKINKRKVKERPSKEKLIELLIENNWTQVAKIFDVSDNAIRKWAKEYNITTNRKSLR